MENLQCVPAWSTKCNSKPKIEHGKGVAWQRIRYSAEGRWRESDAQWREEVSTVAAVFGPRASKIISLVQTYILKKPLLRQWVIDLIPREHKSS